MRRYISTFSLAFVVAGLLLLFFGLRVIRTFVQSSDIASIQRQEELPRDAHYSLVEASALGNIERVRRLIEQGVSPNVVDPIGRSPLRASIESGHVNITQYLLEHGASPNDIDLEGNSALLLSVRHQRVEAFLLLLERGANVNYASKISRTPLYEASLLGMYGMVEKLLEKGANPQTTDIFGNTIIHAAVMSEDIPTLRKVIGATVNVDTANKAGLSPLGLAVSYQLLPQVYVLLDNEAAVHFTDNEGQNVLILAVRSDEFRSQRMDEFAKEVESVGKKTIAREIKEPNIQDIRKTERIVDTLLESFLPTNYALINSRDSLGRTPLMYAALNGNFLVVQTLLRDGANVNLQDREGMSALHLAVQQGYTVVAEDLLKAGADLEIKNKQGKSPVQLAYDIGNPRLQNMLTRQAEEAREMPSKKVPGSKGLEKKGDVKIP